MKIKLTCLALLSLSTIVQAQNIASWSFETIGTKTAPYNSPAATSGTNGGSASVLGMNNSYNGTTSTANADILASAGASTGSGSYGWRIRGTPGNGWSSQASIGTQGAQFSASTVGFDNIQISFDINTTAQAERNLELLYTIDGTTWLNATLSSAGTLAGATLTTGNASDANTVNGSYVELSSTAGWNNQITANLDGAGVDNDPNFAIEIVNASTGTDDVNIGGTAYNNSSGNWRYDNVIISGTSITPTPEPSSIALAGVGIAGLAAAYRRNRKA